MTVLQFLPLLVLELHLVVGDLLAVLLFRFYFQRLEDALWVHLLRLQLLKSGLNHRSLYLIELDQQLRRLLGLQALPDAVHYLLALLPLLRDLVLQLIYLHYQVVVLSPLMYDLLLHRLDLLDLVLIQPELLQAVHLAIREVVGVHVVVTPLVDEEILV